MKTSVEGEKNVQAIPRLLLVMFDFTRSSMLASASRRFGVVDGMGRGTGEDIRARLTVKTTAWFRHGFQVKRGLALTVPSGLPGGVVQEVRLSGDRVDLGLPILWRLLMQGQNITKEWRKDKREKRFTGTASRLSVRFRCGTKAAAHFRGAVLETPRLPPTHLRQGVVLRLSILVVIRQGRDAGDAGRGSRCPGRRFLRQGHGRLSRRLSGPRRLGADRVGGGDRCPLPGFSGVVSGVLFKVVQVHGVGGGEGGCRRGRGCHRVIRGWCPRRPPVALWYSNRRKEWRGERKGEMS